MASLLAPLREEHSCRGGLCAANALRVAMGAFGAALRFGEHLIERLRRVCHRAHAHSRPITPTVIRLTIAGRHPPRKRTAVSRSRIANGIVSQRVDVVSLAQQRVRDGGRQHRVVGEPAALSEQRKVFGLDITALVNRPNHVAGDCTQHEAPFPATSGMTIATVLVNSSSLYTARCAYILDVMRRCFQLICSNAARPSKPYGLPSVS